LPPSLVKNQAAANALTQRFRHPIPFRVLMNGAPKSGGCTDSVLKGAHRRDFKDQKSAVEPFTHRIKQAVG
jgi:hypothetical protein